MEPLSLSQSLPSPIAQPRADRNTSLNRTELAMQRFGAALAVGVAFFCPIVVLHVSNNVIAASDFFMPAMLAVLLLGQRRGRVEACYWALAIFLVIAMFSLLQIDDRREQVRSTLKWIRLVGICLPFYLGMRLEVDQRLMRRVGWALFWGGLIAMAIALVIYILQIPIRAEGQRLWFRGGSFFRAGGLIGETTAFGHLTATWMTLCFGLLVWVVPVRRWYIIAAVLAVVGVGMIFAASSRAALLNLVVFGTSLWLTGRIRRRGMTNVMVASLAGFLALILAVLLTVAGNGSGIIRSGERVVRQFERFVPTGSADQMSSGRLQAWQQYSRTIRQHLLLGCGYKTATRLITNRTPDNSVLSSLLETGLFGLIALGAFAMLTTAALWYRALEGDQLARLMTAAWCGQICQALTNDTHTLLLGVPVLYLITGLALQIKPSEAKAWSIP